jgi:hypothetical protein
MREGKTVIVYFDNTMEDDAVTDAMMLTHSAVLEDNHEVLH